MLGEAIILSLVTSPRRNPIAATPKPPIKPCRWRSMPVSPPRASGGVLHRLRHVVLQAILQPEFIAPTRDLIPILAIAFAFATMRNFYFAQVIYFTNASYLDLVVALLFLVVSTGLSVVLVPTDARKVQPSLDGGLASSPAWPSWCSGGAGTACRSIYRAWRHAVAGDPFRFRRAYDGRASTWPIPAACCHAVIFGLFGGFAIYHFGLLRCRRPRSSANASRCHSR